MNHLCPLDGRYRSRVSEIAMCFGEERFIELCCQIEIKWLQVLIDIPQVRPEGSPGPGQLDHILDNMGSLAPNDYERIRRLEYDLGHQIKAVEEFIRREIGTIRLPGNWKSLVPLVHFGLTSEDVMNLAYAIMVQEAQGNLVSMLDDFFYDLDKVTAWWSHHVMLARTHGQPASPTTMGKELSVFTMRLHDTLDSLRSVKCCAKFSGASGGYNAMMVVDTVDWPKHCRRFVESFGLTYEDTTTQVSGHDWLAEMYHAMMRVNNVGIDMCRDIWQYFLLGYLTTNTSRVGSSTMPHKVNPIEFENAEGNFELANNLASFLADKLTKSRLQRDLSSSTVKRNIGMPFGYTYLAFNSIKHGFKNMVIIDEAMERDLKAHPEVLAEAVQTILRLAGLDDAYMLVKDFCNPFDPNGLMQELERLNIPEEVQRKIYDLDISKYVGLSPQMVTHG